MQHEVTEAENVLVQVVARLPKWLVKEIEHIAIDEGVYRQEAIYGLLCQALGYTKVTVCNIADRPQVVVSEPESAPVEGGRDAD